MAREPTEQELKHARKLVLDIIDLIGNEEVTAAGTALCAGLMALAKMHNIKRDELLGIVTKSINTAWELPFPVKSKHSAGSLH